MWVGGQDPKLDPPHSQSERENTSYDVATLQDEEGELPEFSGEAPPTFSRGSGAEGGVVGVQGVGQQEGTCRPLCCPCRPKGPPGVLLQSPFCGAWGPGTNSVSYAHRQGPSHPCPRSSARRPGSAWLCCRSKSLRSPDRTRS